MQKHFKIDKVEKLPSSEAQITGEISLQFLVELRADAVKHLGKHTRIPGFREGKIPEDVLVKHLGEMSILEEVAELALASEYGHIMKEAEISPIGRPEINVTKLAPGVPLEFKIRVAVEPEFDLPDYKKLAKEAVKESGKEKAEVTDEEVKETLAELEKRGVKPDQPAQAGLEKDDLPSEQGQAGKIEDKVRESLEAQKKMRLLEKKRLTIVERLVKETKLEVPRALVEHEQDKMLAQFKGDVERTLRQSSGQVGNLWQDYLKNAGKTEEDIKSEWREQAEDRAKAELIIAKIAEAEKVEPTESELDHEVEHLKQHYPDVDPLRARVYVFTQLRNQKVLEFLENVDTKAK